MVLRKHKERGVAKEHPKSFLIQLVGFIIFFVIWILDSFIYMYSIVLANIIPFIIRIIFFSILLIVGCSLIFIAGHILFHKETSSSELIITGIFAHTRHPIYLGALIFYLSFIILTFSLISIIGFIFEFIIYNWLANFEEKELEKVFKEEYVEYKKTVPKWLLLI